MAQLPQDNVAAAARVLLAIRAFSISLRTTRDVYLDGESFRLDVTTDDAQGRPTGAALGGSARPAIDRASTLPLKASASSTTPSTPPTPIRALRDRQRGHVRRSPRVGLEIVMSVALVFCATPYK